MTPEAAVPVAVHGFTWTASLVAVLNVLVGGALVAWVKSRPKMAEIQRGADEKLLGTMVDRIAALETARAQQDARAEAERGQHEALMAILRHRLNNVTQCLDALLLLIEQDPGKAADAAARIRKMREQQIIAEAAEKSTIHAAAFKLDAP